jgi:hypothetical protein
VASAAGLISSGAMAESSSASRPGRP